MDRLYSSPAGAPGAAAETVTTPPARPPLEDARPGYGVLSGVMPGVMPPGNRPPSELRNDVADRPSASADQPQARPER
jgi:hypothetical protein